MLQFKLNGRLAADPQLTQYGDDAAPMARLRVASNQPGSARTDFFDVAVFGDKVLAQLEGAAKGDRIRLHGTARQNTWTTETGDNRERINLVAAKLEYDPRHTTDPADIGHSVTQSATVGAQR